MEDNTLVKDDMFFMPYKGNSGGWQCKMEISIGVISVRFGSSSLLVDNKHPYEVWYPTESAPTPYQTADDIWNYIKHGRLTDN